MNWDRKATWHGLLALLFILGLIWITLSREPPDVVAARSQRPPSPQVDAPAPDFSLKTLTGETIRLSNLQGQAVLVNFWATWCLPCRVEMPLLQAMADRHATAGLVVLGLSRDQGPVEGVRAFLAERQITYPVAIVPGSTERQFGGLAGYPTSFLLDRTGRIRHQALGPLAMVSFEPAVRRLLAEPEP